MRSWASGAKRLPALMLTGALLLGAAGCSAGKAAAPLDEPAGSSVSTPEEPASSGASEGLDAVSETPEEPEVTSVYLTFPFSNPEKLERYESYHAQYPDLTIEEAVVRVNIGLDRPFYEEPDQVEDPSSLTALVNKYHALTEDYEPEEERIEAPSAAVQASLRPEAAQAFLEMAQAAAQDGIRLYAVSAYRSYSSQVAAYQRYVREASVELADTYSARPGHSEHQTGLAIDVNTATLRSHFENTAEYAWLQENAGRFGFILRFPQGKEDITGYRFEPWHYRYVGLETAGVCWENGWTLEEYHARQPYQAEEETPDSGR